MRSTNGTFGSQSLSEKEQKKIEETLEKTTQITKTDIMNFDEVSIKRSLFFRLFISGTIEYGNFISSAPIKIKYEFVHGTDWEKEDGKIKDFSQFSCPGDGSYNYYSFNQQFEISFRSINPYGWPQLVLTCCTVDNKDNEVVLGYGCLHAPASVGRHERKVHIFSSTNDQSFWGRFCGTAKSKTNEVTSTPKVISTGEGREISRAIYQGWIKIVFQIGFRDLDKFGYISN